MIDSRPHGRRVPTTPCASSSPGPFASAQRSNPDPPKSTAAGEPVVEDAALNAEMSQNTVLLISERQSDVESWREAARAISLRAIHCAPSEITDELLRREAVSVIVGGASAGGPWMEAAAESGLLARLATIIVLDSDQEHFRVEPNRIRIWGALSRSHVESMLPAMLATAVRHGAELRRMYCFVLDYRKLLERLSADEREVLHAVCLGIPNKKTARRQQCSLRTVENRRSRVYAHFGVTSAAQLAGHAATARAYETLLDID